MKNIFFAIAVFFILQPVQAADLWTVSEGLEGPESAVYDPVTDAIYVSNTAGGATEKNGLGYISQLTKDGKMIQQKWIDNLNSPKGMAIHNGVLYVADIGSVHAFDLKTKKSVDFYFIGQFGEGNFLNDIAIGDDGTIYVSNTFANKIFQIKNGKASFFLETEMMGRPNGLKILGDLLFVGAWGWGELDADTFKTEVPGTVYAINVKTKAFTMLRKYGIGQMDGVEFSSDKRYVYTTDWVKGAVYAVSTEGNVFVIAEDFTNAADLGVIEGRQFNTNDILLVPDMGENKLRAIEIK